MADQFTSEQRSAVMRRVRSVNTCPELLVQQVVHRLGFRFGLHAQNLPGKPDLILKRQKKVVFVHGCYWHQHKCDAAKRPATNQRYWNRKLDNNVQRDKRNIYLLRRQGWRVLTVWECELRNTERVERRLFRFLNSGAA